MQSIVWSPQASEPTIVDVVQHHILHKHTQATRHLILPYRLPSCTCVSMQCRCESNDAHMTIVKTVRHTYQPMCENKEVLCTA